MRRLHADRARRTIEFPDGRVVENVPDEFWAYELGGKACVEHVLDGWRARLKQPRSPYLRAHFPAPVAFTPDEVEAMYDNVARMCTVAVQHMAIVRQLAAASPLNPANHPPGWQGPKAPPATKQPPAAKQSPVRPGFVQMTLRFPLS